MENEDGVWPATPCPPLFSTRLNGLHPPSYRPPTCRLQCRLNEGGQAEAGLAAPVEEERGAPTDSSVPWGFTRERSHASPGRVRRGKGQGCPSRKYPGTGECSWGAAPSTTGSWRDPGWRRSEV